MRTHCPICASQNLLRSVAIDALPALCNALHSDAVSARAAAIGRLEIKFCRDCGHVFNAAFEEDRVGYSQSYENSLHFSNRFSGFAESLGQRLQDSYHLDGKTVVDIGCGKGEFLKQLCTISNATGIGFDKSFEESRDAAVPNVRFVSDWFSHDYADIRPDLLTCRHVIEHIAEPLHFLQSLRSHPGIRPETVFYFEVPNALYTLRDLGIWDLIYEHVSYFTPSSFRTAVEASGFEVISEGTGFGDQYLYVEAKPGRVHRHTHAGIGDLEALVHSFEDAYRRKLSWWRTYLAERATDHTVVWGAGSKGITFVNVVPEARRIDALIDLNPHKQGRFAPITGTPVRSPESLRSLAVQSVIVMNPLYLNEVIETTEMLGLQAEFVVA